MMEAITARVLIDPMLNQKTASLASAGSWIVTIRSVG